MPEPFIPYMLMHRNIPVSGFATDTGKQIFVEGKSIKKLDVGRLFRTAGISGLSGMTGAMLGVFRDIFSEYRVETVHIRKL